MPLLAANENKKHTFSIEYAKCSLLKLTMTNSYNNKVYHANQPNNIKKS